MTVIFFWFFLFSQSHENVLIIFDID